MPTIQNPEPRQVSQTFVDRKGYYVKVDLASEITEFVIKSDTIFDEYMVRESKRELEQLRPKHKHLLLVTTEGFVRLTKKARKIGASKEFSTHMAAVACYTSNYSLALLGELYNKINKPAVPTRVFNSRELAVEWLLEKGVEQKTI